MAPPTKKNLKRWYVGFSYLNNVRSPALVKLSFAEVKAKVPNTEFTTLVGPFDTKRGAQWFCDNPTTPLQSVAEMEKESQKESTNGTGRND